MPIKLEWSRIHHVRNEMLKGSEILYQTSSTAYLMKQLKDAAIVGLLRKVLGQDAVDAGLQDDVIVARDQTHLSRCKSGILHENWLLPSK